MPAVTLGRPNSIAGRSTVARAASVSGLAAVAARAEAPAPRHVTETPPTADDGKRPSSAPGRRRASAASSHIRSDDDDDDDNVNDNNDGMTMATRPSRPSLALRSRSYHGTRADDSDATTAEDDIITEWGARHGFEDHYQSEDIISQLANGWYMYYTDHRHETTGKPKALVLELQDWRMRERLKTVSAALALCLNIGVEPPDQLRTSPGAKLEAWKDPAMPKALEAIGKALQAQYEDLAIRTRYKQYLDPSVDETKKFCISLRRNAKDERILLHYNGHGVPKPTASGEIWVFNRSYTQYIPVSLYDLQNWLQAPTIYVWDCSEAGNIISNYHKFADKHESEEADAAARDPAYDRTPFRPYIHLAACAVKEHLPTNPLLPADLFTACLTTPIEMALWFFVLQNPLRTGLTPDRAKNLPGRLQERRTPKGELMWILTAITDTIAWTTLPRDMFRKYFRQDLMVAGLFRNFLLAQRIMSVYGCHPQSFPALPDTHQHPQWQSWDLAVDLALTQLPMLEKKDANESFEYEYQHSSYFTEQLTAFDVYLTRGDAMERKPPEQLPVVLQVLLSQQHRVRALILLGKFLDLGPWAVQLALSIGIFPYVVKLLQSNAVELKAVMVFIWTRIVAVDISCQPDLVKDNGYNYFAQILRPEDLLPVVDPYDHKAMCAFILAMLCRRYKPGQSACNGTDVMSYCLAHVAGQQQHTLLRQWACLCLSQLWCDFPEAKWRGLRENAPARLALLAQDPCCEVRAAMLYAMTTFLGIPDLTNEVARMEESLAWTVMDMANDGSPMVRKEFVMFLSHFVCRFENKFVVAAFEHMQDESRYQRSPPPPRDGGGGGGGGAGLHASADGRNNDAVIKTTTTTTTTTTSTTAATTTTTPPPPPPQQQPPPPPAQNLSHNTVFAACWKHALVLSVDPHPEVQHAATIVVDHVHRAVLNSPVSASAMSLRDEIRARAEKVAARASGAASTRASVVGVPAAAPATSSSPSILRRTASLLFTSFLGGEDKSRPTTPPTPGAGAGTNASSKGQRLRVPLDMTSAPPEQSDQANAPADYNAAREPVSGAYQERDLTMAPLLPLQSTFLDWSIEYFREPQMRPSEADEPGSTVYNERLWRRSRNEAIMRETQPQKQFAGSHKWNNQLGLMNNGAQPARMTFHQFEDHLAVADDGNTVYVWDWKKQKRLSWFSNGNPEGSVISDMKFINEDDQALLLSGSSDGVIRIYRDYDSERTELASAWRALTHMVPSNVNSGMVFDWQQVTGRVLVAGDVRVIRVWSAANETCFMDIPARSGSCVTSITSDQMTGNIFVAGFGDGAVRVFDIRQRPQDSMVRKWKNDSDRQWIKNVHMQRGGQRELMSASRNGRVKLWDIRMDKPLHTFQATRETLRTASLHEHLPVFAVGTSAHAVKVFNLDGQELSRSEPYANFLNPGRGAPISTTAFHPHRPVLGCAARGDFHINLLTCDRTDQSMFGLG